MFRFTRTVSLLILFALLVGCVPSPAAIVSGQAVKSGKPRVASPQVSLEDQQALSAGNTAFALDLYRALDDGGSNLFFSPYSISLALAMTYAGAQGETAAQMAETLHFALPPDRLHPAFNAVDQELNTRKEAGGQGADGRGFRLNVVNDIWGQQDYQFRPEFLDVLAQNYGAGLRLMNFKQDPEGTRKAINEYIADQTEGRIKDLLPANVVDQNTRLVLTNAIYFNAAWHYPFEKSRTEDAPFALLDGSQVQAPQMAMSGTSYLQYGHGDGYQAIALPYENMQLSMLLIVPDAGQFDSFTSSLDAARFEQILSTMDGTQAHVRMPRFELEGEFALEEVLPKMGMTDAFEFGAADFSGMDNTRDLFIGAVQHKSFVKVDEAGTEAAAATVVEMAAGAAPGDPVQLVIDRPFLFLIRDRSTGTILFFGQVTNPKQ